MMVQRVKWRGRGFNIAGTRQASVISFRTRQLSRRIGAVPSQSLSSRIHFPSDMHHRSVGGWEPAAVARDDPSRQLRPTDARCYCLQNLAEALVLLLRWWSSGRCRELSKASRRFTTNQKGAYPALDGGNASPARRSGRLSDGLAHAARLGTPASVHQKCTQRSG